MTAVAKPTVLNSNWAVAVTIEMKRWGRDHWGTLAYAASMKNNEWLVKERMRCDPRRHRVLAHLGSSSATPPTRLADGTEVPDHDDWDCLADLVEAGLITHPLTRANPRRICLTDKGWWYANRITRAEHEGREWHKVNEGCDGSEAPTT